jgi:hypothetical protein
MSPPTPSRQTFLTQLSHQYPSIIPCKYAAAMQGFYLLGVEPLQVASKPHALPTPLKKHGVIFFKCSK